MYMLPAHPEHQHTSCLPRVPFLPPLTICCLTLCCLYGYVTPSQESQERKIPQHSGCGIPLSSGDTSVPGPAHVSVHLHKVKHCEGNRLTTLHLSISCSLIALFPRERKCDFRFHQQEKRVESGFLTSWGNECCKT